MFEVIWLREAFEEADRAFLAADPLVQQRFSGLIDTINRELAQAPMSLGESRESGFRIAFFDFLAVRYQVDTVTQSVRVSSVRSYGS